MEALIKAVHRAVMEFYDERSPWPVQHVKFAIDFDDQGRVGAITYTPIPDEHKDKLLERVREACTPFGDSFRGRHVQVFLTFKAK